MPPSAIERFRRRVASIRRRYTVMIHSGPGSGVRNLSVPALAIPALALVVGLGVIGGGAALLDWTAHRIDAERLERLAAENLRLTDRLAEIRDVVETFEVRMEQNEQIEERFRALASLEAIPEDVRRLGIGGPPTLSELADRSFGSENVQQARATLDQLEELDRRAEFQAANFREMVDVLEQSQKELARVPSISPIRRGWFSSRYGTREDPFTKRQTFHRGLDFSASTGTPVYATADGKVRKAGRHGVLGLLVEIDHDNGILTRYGHNSKLLVKVGQKIRRGDRIAEVGSTGRSTSPHCHYEVHVEGRHVNPWRYILDGGPQMSRGA